MLHLYRDAVKTTGQEESVMLGNHCCSLEITIQALQNHQPGQTVTYAQCCEVPQDRGLIQTLDSVEVGRISH